MRKTSCANHGHSLPADPLANAYSAGRARIAEDRRAIRSIFRFVAFKTDASPALAGKKPEEKPKPRVLLVVDANEASTRNIDLKYALKSAGFVVEDIDSENAPWKLRNGKFDVAIFCTPPPAGAEEHVSKILLEKDIARLNARGVCRKMAALLKPKEKIEIKRILLVEDEPPQRELFKTWLEEMCGYTVVAAAGVGEAIEIIEHAEKGNDKIDLIVSDLKFKVKGDSAKDLVDFLINEGFDFPIIVISATSEDAESLRKDVDLVMEKCDAVGIGKKIIEVEAKRNMGLGGGSNE